MVFLKNRNYGMNVMYLYTTLTVNFTVNFSTCTILILTSILSSLRFYIVILLEKPRNTNLCW